MNLLSRFWAWLGEPVGGKKPTEGELAAERWRKSNLEAKLQGCRCGAPATVVRRMRGTVGGVPAEIWSCEDHWRVNGWHMVDGAYVPYANYDGEDDGLKMEHAMDRWTIHVKREE